MIQQTEYSGVWMAYSNSTTNTTEKYKPTSLRMMDQVREVLRYHHYGLRTEDAYLRWIRPFIHFNDTRHPKDMGKTEIEKFLTDLATNRNVAAST